VSFRNLDLAGVPALIEMLELRTNVEGDAAGLAAQRGSPAKRERIAEAFNSLRRLSRKGKPAAEAHFNFHLAIAEAGNKRGSWSFCGRSVSPATGSYFGIPGVRLGGDADPAELSYPEKLDAARRLKCDGAD
jgi:hypothetical protein